METLQNGKKRDALCRARQDATTVPPPRRTDVREYRLDGEAILVDPTTSRTYLLNQTAFAVWRRCDGRATTWQIAQEQTNTCQVKFEVAFDHVEQVVTWFAASQLLDSGNG